MVGVARKLEPSLFRAPSDRCDSLARVSRRVDYIRSGCQSGRDADAEGPKLKAERDRAGKLQSAVTTSVPK
jgi:hypothetical protein